VKLPEPIVADVAYSMRFRRARDVPKAPRLQRCINSIWLVVVTAAQSGSASLVLISESVKYT
jgi:hypothetical protein